MEEDYFMHQRDTLDQHSLRGNWAIIPAIVFLSLVASLHLTGDLYGDEWGHTYPVLQGDFWTNIWNTLPFYPPLYFVLAKFFVWVTGSLWAIRLPALLFSLGTVLLAPKAARELLGRSNELPALIIAATSPFLIEFSVEGRAYALLIFFSLTACWLFWRFLQQETLGNTTILILVLLGGALSHYFFWLLFPAMAIYYLYTRRTISRYSIAMAIALCACLAPLLYLRSHLPMQTLSANLQAEWSGRYFDLLNALGRWYVAFNYGYCTFRLPPLDPARNVPWRAILENGLLGLFLLMALVGTVWGVYRLLLKRQPILSYTLCMMIMVLGMGNLAGLMGVFLVREKFFAIIWAFFWLLLLLIWKEIKKFWVGRLAAVAWLLLVLVSLFNFCFCTDDYSRRMNWRGLIYYLEKEATAADLLLVYSNPIQDLALQPNALPAMIEISLASRQNPEMDVIEHLEQIEATYPGRIFLINNETDRYSVDPDRKAIIWLIKKRGLTDEFHFGRNVSLLCFRQKEISNVP